MAKRWTVVFFPPPGERHSPADFIKEIVIDSERSHVARRLEFISQHEIGDWPNTWVHKLTNNISQLTAGKHRIMYAIDDRKIVVVHCCRKAAQKTKARDLNRAELNYKSYISSRG